MKSGIKLAIFLTVILIFSGCAYVHTKTPYDQNLNETELGSKVGVADAYGLFWLVAWGDASYAAAAKNGNITVLKHADQETKQIFFGIYSHWRVIVYGD
jgi:hypothetical protein